MSVSRRVAQLETKERPEKKTKKEPLSVKDKMLLQCEKIGQVVERALENLEKKEAPSSDEDQDILDYVRNSLRKLDPGRRFELKCELRQLCKDAVEPKKPVGEVNLWESNFGF